MATGLSLALRANQLDIVFLGTTPTTPLITGGTLFLGLSTTDPGDAGAGITEPTIGSGGYARVSVTTGTTNWNASSTGSNPATVTNKVAFSFPTSTGSGWTTGATTLGFFFLSSASSAGTFYCRGTVTPPTAVAATGITLSFAAGQMSITNAFT